MTPSLVISGWLQVAGANRDALCVDDLRDIVRVDALEAERDDPDPATRTVEPEAGTSQAPERVLGQLVLVAFDRREVRPVT